jgi:hypothetical protein
LCARGHCLASLRRFCDFVVRDVAALGEILPKSRYGQQALTKGL